MISAVGFFFSLCYFLGSVGIPDFEMATYSSSPPLSPMLPIPAGSPPPTPPPPYSPPPSFDEAVAREGSEDTNSGSTLEVSEPTDGNVREEGDGSSVDGARADARAGIDEALSVLDRVLRDLGAEIEGLTPSDGSEGGSTSEEGFHPDSADGEGGTNPVTPSPPLCRHNFQAGVDDIFLPEMPNRTDCGQCWEEAMASGGGLGRVGGGAAEGVGRGREDPPPGQELGMGAVGGVGWRSEGQGQGLEEEVGAASEAEWRDGGHGPGLEEEWEGDVRRVEEAEGDVRRGEEVEEEVRSCDDPDRGGISKVVMRHDAFRYPADKPSTGALPKYPMRRAAAMEDLSVGGPPVAVIKPFICSPTKGATSGQQSGVVPNSSGGASNSSGGAINSSGGGANCSGGAANSSGGAANSSAGILLPSPYTAQFGFPAQRSQCYRCMAVVGLAR